MTKSREHSETLQDGFWTSFANLLKQLRVEEWN